ncbi:GIY-YIG nuclease family protein [Mycolicibacterium hodleri]|uniref:GIY-YIG nuclease family protein n=1 Tax=Mycolicibacterium hodleri TaxID=49897 RepID=UPI001F208E26|nr:GIY-YIG nuclease family protein [Mycolicibacterium hodleri]
MLGDDPNSLGGTIAYIGEGDDVSKRLYEHARPADQGGKDFWERAIVLTSKDSNLTKAHARYLESRLIALTQQAKRALLVNGTAPTPLPLPEADISDMEYFIAQAKIVLPVLGVNMLRSVSAAQPAGQTVGSAEVSGTQVSPLFEMTLKKSGITAIAQEIDGEFTVHEGSQARAEWTGVDDGYKRLREKLEKDGTLGLSGDGASALFTRDHVFASPSAGAAVVAGRSANGRNEWKVQGTGVSFGSWQSQGVDQALTEASS